MTKQKKFYIAKICIVRPPTGEAPEEIRAAWVGIVFSRAARSSEPFETVGVLTQPRTYFGQRLASWLGRTSRTAGYAVEVNAAMAALEAHAPHAALWWRENAPHVIRPNGFLIFNEDACQEL